MMKNSFRYFKNAECEFYPCHEIETEEFNCLFCFCPLYYIDCPGRPRYITLNGSTIKDCSKCDLPHRPDNYEPIIEILKNLTLETPKIR